MRFHPTFALIALVAFDSCSSRPTDPTVEHPLAGAFDWVYSNGGVAHKEVTPAEIGYTVRFEFDGTHVRTYRNDQLIDDTRFTIREDLQRQSPSPVYIVAYEQPLRVFTFSQLDEHTLHWAGKVILVLDEGCCDRYVHTITKPFVR